MKRTLLVTCLLFFSIAAHAKQFTFVELGLKQSEIYSQQRNIYSLVTDPSFWKKKNQTIVLAFMTNSVEKASGEDTEKLNFLFYGGPRFEIKNRINHELYASIHTSIVFGAAKYQRVSTNETSELGGLFVGLEPGARVNWHVNREVSLHAGISALSGTLEQNVTVEAFPSYEFAMSYQW